MEQLFELFLKSGLRPLKLIPEASKLEDRVNRSELASLLILHFYDEMTMSELADRLGSPLSTLTSLSKRLVRKGFIEQTQSEKDQRIKLIRLTDDGKKVAEQAKDTIQSILIRVQTTLSHDELNQFIHLALKVIKALQEKDDSVRGSQKIQFRKIQIDD